MFPVIEDRSSVLPIILHVRGRGVVFCVASLSDLLYGFVSSLSGQHIPMQAIGIVHCYLLDGGSITRFQNIIPFDIIGIAILDEL